MADNTFLFEVNRANNLLYYISVIDLVSREQGNRRYNQ